MYQARLMACRAVAQPQAIGNMGFVRALELEQHVFHYFVSKHRLPQVLVVAVLLSLVLGSAMGFVWWLWLHRCFPSGLGLHWRAWHYEPDLCMLGHVVHPGGGLE